MTTIYENAFITIAATASAGCEEGLRFSRPPAMKHLSEFHVRWAAEPEPCFRELPLYKRGWTLQEIVLSRRLVHFADEQLYWVCRSGSESEDGMSTTMTGTAFFQLVSPPGIPAHNLWWDWVEDYSRRLLTVREDKLPALAGLVRKFQQSTQAIPAVGLWIEDIHYGLLWWPTTTPAARTLLDMPSWSWASVDGPVSRMYQRGTDDEQQSQQTNKAGIETEGLTVRWEGGVLAELTSRISEATLRANGRLKQANYAIGQSILYRIDAWQPWQTEPHGQLLHKSVSHGRRRKSSLLFDAGVPPSDKQHTNLIWCLEISTGCRNHYNFSNFLILEPSEIEPNQYLRVGIGCVWEEPWPFNDHFFDGVKMQKVILV